MSRQLQNGAFPGQPHYKEDISETDINENLLVSPNSMLKRQLREHILEIQKLKGKIGFDEKNLADLRSENSQLRAALSHNQTEFQTLNRQ